MEARISDMIQTRAHAHDAHAASTAEEGAHTSGGERSVSHHIDACTFDLAYAYWLNEKETTHASHKDEYDAYDAELHRRGVDRERASTWEHSTAIQRTETSYVRVYPATPSSAATATSSWDQDRYTSASRVAPAPAFDYMLAPPRLTRSHSAPQHPHPHHQHPAHTLPSYVTPPRLGALTARSPAPSPSIYTSRPPLLSRAHSIPTSTTHSPSHPSLPSLRLSSLAPLPDTDPDDYKQHTSPLRLREVMVAAHVGEAEDRINMYANDEGQGDTHDTSTTGHWLLEPAPEMPLPPYVPPVTLTPILTPTPIMHRPSSLHTSSSFPAFPTTHPHHTILVAHERNDDEHKSP